MCFQSLVTVQALLIRTTAQEFVIFWYLVNISLWHTSFISSPTPALDPVSSFSLRLSHVSVLMKEIVEEHTALSRKGDLESCLSPEDEFCKTGQVD